MNGSLPDTININDQQYYWTRGLIEKIRIIRKPPRVGKLILSHSLNILLLKHILKKFNIVKKDGVEQKDDINQYSLFPGELIDTMRLHRGDKIFLSYNTEAIYTIYFRQSLQLPRTVFTEFYLVNYHNIEISKLHYLLSLLYYILHNKYIRPYPDSAVIHVPHQRKNRIPVNWSKEETSNMNEITNKELKSILDILNTEFNGYISEDLWKLHNHDFDIASLKRDFNSDDDLVERVHEFYSRILAGIASDGLGYYVPRMYIRLAVLHLINIMSKMDKQARIELMTYIL